MPNMGRDVFREKPVLGRRRNGASISSRGIPLQKYDAILFAPMAQARRK
jgi:hypothetical protein